MSDPLELIAWTRLRHAMLSATALLTGQTRAALYRGDHFSVWPCGRLDRPTFDEIRATAIANDVQPGMVALRKGAFGVAWVTRFEDAQGTVVTLCDGGEAHLEARGQVLLVALARRISEALDGMGLPDWRASKSQLVVLARAARCLPRLASLALAPPPSSTLIQDPDTAISAVGVGDQGSQSWLILGPASDGHRPLVTHEGVENRYTRFLAEALELGLHETGGSLTSLQGHSELLRDLIPTAPESRPARFAEIIRADALRLGEAVGTLRGLARLQVRDIAVHQLIRR